MPISINGSGTVTGISVGGLPDGIVDTDMLAAAAVTAAKRGAGAILQVVYGYDNSQITNNTSTYADTGLSATITPSSTSNKILVLASQACNQKSGNNYFRMRLLRNSTEIAKIDDGAGYTNNGNDNIVGTIGCSLMDTPVDTNAHTYKLQFMTPSNSALVLVNCNNALSTMLLMELAG